MTNLPTPTGPRHLWYVLGGKDGHTPIPSTVEEASKMLGARGVRQVARTQIGEMDVSTVFLALDHAYQGRPKVFETMTFGGPDDSEVQGRYSTWEEAEAGHQTAVARAIAINIVTRTDAIETLTVIDPE